MTPPNLEIFLKCPYFIRHLYIKFIKLDIKFIKLVKSITLKNVLSLLPTTKSNDKVSVYHRIHRFLP